jgi:hypothetical protein
VFRTFALLGGRYVSKKRAVNIRAVYGFSFRKMCEKEGCIAACHLVFPIEHSKRITLVFNNIVIKKKKIEEK